MSMVPFGLANGWAAEFLIKIGHGISYALGRMVRYDCH